MIAGETADLLERRKPIERGFEKRGVGRRDPSGLSEFGQHPARPAQADQAVDERAGLREKFDVHHPSGAELDLPGMGGGAFMRLGQSAGGVFELQFGAFSLSVVASHDDDVVDCLAFRRVFQR